MSIYLPQIIEEPGDELGGASGAKRTFNVRFLGKFNNADFPFTIANEVVATAIGQAIGLNLPSVLTYRIGQTPYIFVHLVDKTSSMGKHESPPVTSAALRKWVEAHPQEVHGALIMDLFLANNDRAFGPERRNLFLDLEERLVLYDNSNGCFYRHRPAAGIVAGIPRLDAVEADLDAMFDMSHKKNTYFEYLQQWDQIAFWIDRIKSLPDFFFVNVVERIPGYLAHPTASERERLIKFLIARKEYLADHIHKKQSKWFPNLPHRGNHA